MMETASTTPSLTLSEIAEIEIVILKRMKEFAMGDHASVFKGQGFNFVGVRDWEPGDRLSSIDWPQSSLTNFSPLITREFEQDSNATVVAVADASLSTRCGANGALIATAIARSIAAVGLSSVLLQDQFGLITVDGEFRPITVVRPRIGKPHVLYCLDVYHRGQQVDTPASRGDSIDAVAGYLRRRSLVPVISDFLFERAPDVLQKLSRLNSTHDVFLVMADARFAYRLPDMSDGWIRTVDVETGATRILSRREFAQLARRIEEWQDRMLALARDVDLDIVRIGLDRWEMETVLTEFLAERRLRKV